MNGVDGAAAGERPAFRVLVVDDNRDAADSLCMLLEMWGYQARAVYDGPGALTAARAYRPDCLLTDIGLPGLDGYRLAGEVRRDEALRGATLVAVTAYSDAAGARAAGFDHHFVKPADPVLLQAMLRRLEAMGKRLERDAEVLLQEQMEVVTEARDLMKEVKGGVGDMKHGLEAVKEEIQEVKQEVKKVKEELRELKEERDGAAP